jgi:hypothetical protein
VPSGDAGEAGSRTEVYALAPPPPRGESQKLVDEHGSSAEKILAFLVEKKLV